VSVWHSHHITTLCVQPFIIPPFSPATVEIKMASRSLSFLALLLLLALVSAATDPDTGRSTVQLIQARGFPVQSHTATTADGYKLTLHRIPNPGKPVVLLQHGLLDTSETWVVNSATDSLGYILHSQGYDVFLGNVRGNKYALSHQTLSSKSSKFWDFDWDHHALSDLPALIATALSITGKATLALVGHSQGATTSFVALTQVPGLAKKVNLFVALAPVTALSHSGAKPLSYMAKFKIDSLLGKLGNREIVPKPDTLKKMLGFVCRFLPSVCLFSASSLFGKTTHVSKARMGVYAASWPDRTSIRNMRHWIQNARSGKFASYDQKTDYMAAMKYISVPTLVYSAGKDLLGNPGDTQTLVSNLQLSSKFIAHHAISDYNHMDFVDATDAPTLVYSVVAQSISRYSSPATTAARAMDAPLEINSSEPVELEENSEVQENAEEVLVEQEGAEELPVEQESEFQPEQESEFQPEQESEFQPEQESESQPEQEELDLE
jgi:pimeloyl-ACP methyl ester carboxylesterase